MIARRLLVAGVLAAALSIVHVASAMACMCELTDVAGAVRGADVAFVGTVVDQVPDPAAVTVLHAIRVERSTMQPADEVVMVDGMNNTSCGVFFGVGERWFVAATLGEAGLETQPCSGSAPLSALPGPDRLVLDDLLGVEIEAAADDGSAGIPTPIVAALLVAAAVASVSIVAFRGRGSLRPR